MSQVSDQRGWEGRDLTDKKQGKPEKRDDLGNKQVRHIKFKMSREHAGGCAQQAAGTPGWGYVSEQS